MKNKGFEVIELLVVIVVIGILTAITIVSFDGIQEKQKNAESELRAECEKYNVIPEEHVDLVPTACVTEYFKNNTHKR